MNEEENPMATHVSTNLTDDARTLNRRSLLRNVAATGLAAPALVALLSSGAGIARAAEPLSGRLDALLQGAVAGGFPGIALYVERAGKPIYSGAAGVASIESETPLKTTDRHRIYSIAKTFTAIVTMQLVDEGALSLDDTVTKWLDEPAVARIPNTDRVTLRHLLIHTSGIYDFADDDSPFWADAFLGPDADWTKVWTPRELLPYADGANHAPYFAPGESYHYSNTNFILVGLIVEAATGRPYGAELKTRILDALALKDTFLPEGAAMPDGTVDIYHLLDGELVNLSASNLSWDWTAGGMVSTMADLARFSRAVFAGELVSPASFKEMFAFFPAKGPGYYEGIGLYKIDTPSGAMVGMDGSGPGANSAMMRLETADLTVILLDNMAPDEGATELLRDEVVRVVLESA
jgi:D-alanyl-D-alanine carboxypeptidase